MVLIAAGLMEHALHQKRLAKIPIRILVNGTRGKTSVSKILVAALNQNGVRTVGRTTGSEASMIMPDGTIVPIQRRSYARITEMLPFVRRCSEENLACIVVECMALGAENQHVFSDVLLKPTHIAITNSYVDHMVEIGATEEETVWTLSRCLHRGSEVFCAEDAYAGYCEQAGSTFHRVVVRDYESGKIESSIRMHDSNLSIAVDLLETLGISEERVVGAVQAVVPDIGLIKEVTGEQGAVFIMDFAVNDLFNMDKAIVDASATYGVDQRLCILFNNRKDREYRLLHMETILKKHAHLIAHVYCIGDYPVKVSRFFAKRCAIPASPMSDQAMYETICAAGGDTVFLGLGNIKGSGEWLVRRCLEKGER